MSQVCPPLCQTAPPLPTTPPLPIGPDPSFWFAIPGFAWVIIAVIVGLFAGFWLLGFLDRLDDYLFAFLDKHMKKAKAKDKSRRRK